MTARLRVLARHAGPKRFRRAGPDLAAGPVGIVLAEDPVQLDTTLSHMAAIGFGALVLFAPPTLADPVIENAVLPLHRVDWCPAGADAVPRAVNAVIDAAPGRWVHYAFNAEYLFYPFRETRSIGEMLAFHAEERREAMLTYVVDLYAGDLLAAPDAVDLDAAYLDRSGYYALSRRDPGAPGLPLERQLDFFGGLRWRFEEHVPQDRRRIDRISILRARKGLRLRADHTLSDAEMNTYACPWHNNLTAAVCSFRTAKALRANPGSREAIGTFRWHNSLRFDWQSQQLMDLGLMEPGQWF